MYLAQIATLLVVYAIAAVRDDPPVQQAVLWGLAISWALASMAVVWILADAEQAALALRSLADRRFRRLLALAWLAMLVIAVHITFSGDATGAWALTTSASLLPLVAAAALLAPVRNRPSGARSEAETDVLPAGGAEPVVGGVLEAPLALHRLVDRDVAATLPSTCPVAIDAAFLEAALDALRPRDGRQDEQGGVALTTRVGDTLLVLGAVLVEQMTATPTYCEFSTIDVDRVRRSIDDLDGEPDVDLGVRLTVTWIHTHPRLGVFLSGTDTATASQWRALDPAFTPIVVDASRSRLDEQIGVFDADARQMLPMSTVDGLVDPAVARKVRRAVVETYRAEGQPDPLVLIGEPASSRVRADRRQGGSASRAGR
jgi:hypothetical protein